MVSQKRGLYHRRVDKVKYCSVCTLYIAGKPGRREVFFLQYSVPFQHCFDISLHPALKQPEIKAFYVL